MGHSTSAPMPADAAADIAGFLTSTQARAALCAFRLDKARRGAVFEGLAARCRGAGPADDVAEGRPAWAHGDNDALAAAEDAWQAAVAEGLDARAAFWAAQRRVCEACLGRCSCVRAPCSQCSRGRGRHRVRFRGVDICCSCALDFVLASDVEQRRLRIVHAAEPWRGRYVGAGDIRVSFPRDLGYDFAGVLVREATFERAEASFWDSVGRARSLRQSCPIFFWARSGKLSQADVDRCERSQLLASAPPRTSHNLFASMAWQVVSEAREEWAAVELGDEDGFFEAEERVLSKLQRAVTLLHKVDRLGHAKAKAAVFEGRQTRLLKRPQLQLDAAGIVLCGAPISSLGTRVPSKLVRETAKELVRRFGVSALHATELEAADMKRRLDRNEATAALSSACAAARLQAGSRRGLSVAEVWCGDPQVLRRLVQHASGDSPPVAFEAFMTVLEAPKAAPAAPTARSRKGGLVDPRVSDTGGGQNAEGSDASEIEPVIEDRKGRGDDDEEQREYWRKRRMMMKRRKRPTKKKAGDKILFSSRAGKNFKAARNEPGAGSSRVIRGADLLM